MRSIARLLALSLTLALASSAFAQTPLKPNSLDPVLDAPDYKAFNDFCLKTYGAAHEDFTYTIPGKDLKILDDGHWQHVSESSACIAFDTNLPSLASIDYGTTIDYGQSTPHAERPFYVHVHTLTNLKPDTTYHYRIVAVDERGNKITSPDKTFTTAAPKNAIRISAPKDGKFPIELAQADATYILTEDLTAPGTAIQVTGPRITLDLNGHTVTYNQKPAEKDPNAQKGFGFLATEGAQGIRFGYGGRDGRLLNGRIVQGAGNSATSLPVMMRGAEVAGITVIYRGPQQTGFQNELKEFHHNVIVDLGSDITNRHSGPRAINGSTASVHHNLIKRVRQNGIYASNNSATFRNEIYVDSCSTNSFAINFYKTQNASAKDNRIFGTGYLAIGIGTVSDGVGNIDVTGNFIHMQAVKPSPKWKEYGEQSGAYCVRLTWGGDKITCENNVLVSKARDGGMSRGIWFCPGPKIKDVVYRKNLIKVEAENDASDLWGAIVISGEDKPETLPGLFEENTIISNFCNVRLGEDYGTGTNARFVKNTFIRSGKLPRYATIRLGYGHTKNQGNLFVDNAFKDGAGLDKVTLTGDGPSDFTAACTLTIKTTPGAKITISDKDNKPIKESTADNTGAATLEIPTLQRTHQSTTTFGPHKITIEMNGKSISKSVDLTAPITLEIPL